MAEPLTCTAGRTPWQADWRHGEAPKARADGLRYRRQGPAQPLARARIQRWHLLSHLELGAPPGAVACARLHARQVLWEWGLSAIAENAELLVSELVTNATEASQSADRILPVGLWLSSDQSRLLILVQDTCRYPPEPTGGAAADDERGRGLLIVDAISTRWGWETDEDSRGKVVWALIEWHKTAARHTLSGHICSPITSHSAFRGPQRCSSRPTVPRQGHIWPAGRGNSVQFLFRADGTMIVAARLDARLRTADLRRRAQADRADPRVPS